MKYKFTIFTPTYNRAYCIEKVYQSLLKQTISDFEWVVIDDGSSDGTRELISSFANEGKIDIVYYYQKNQGKHVAQNYAVSIARGELFLPLDSDDIIVPNALEVLYQAWGEIPQREQKKYSGIGCHCKDQNGNLIGDPWPEEVIVSNDLEMNFRYKISGEKWGPIRTEILKQYTAPAVKGHYLSENTIWYQIAEKYKKLYISDCLRVYEIHEDSVTTGIKVLGYNMESEFTATQIYINNWYKWYIQYRPLEAIKLPLRLLKYGKYLNRPYLIGKDSCISCIKNPLGCIIAIVGFPIYFLSKGAQNGNSAN